MVILFLVPSTQFVDIYTNPTNWYFTVSEQTGCLSVRQAELNCLRKVYSVEAPSERLATLYNYSGYMPPPDAEPDLNQI